MENFFHNRILPCRFLCNSIVWLLPVAVPGQNKKTTFCRKSELMREAEKQAVGKFRKMKKRFTKGNLFLNTRTVY